MVRQHSVFFAGNMHPGFFLLACGRKARAEIQAPRCRNSKPFKTCFSWKSENDGND
jgi:hypothetical protein